MTSILNSVVKEVTPLVAYGLIAIAAILSFIGLSYLSESNDLLKAQLKISAAELATLEQLQGKDIWDRRLEQSKMAQKEVEEQFWEGATIGVVVADFEQTVRRIAAVSSANQLQITVDPKLETLSDSSVVFFDFRSQVKLGVDAVDLIASISNEPRKIFFKDATISLTESQGSRVIISGFIPVRILSEASP